MTNADLDSLLALLRTPSPTGYEAEGQRVWAGGLRPHADRVESDAYGSAWATLDGAAPGAARVMLEAHADEIGFTVKHVTDDGFVRIDRLGGSDPAIARARRLVFLGDAGPVPGVVGHTAIHLRDKSAEEKAPKWEELFVDVGAAHKDEVAARGLRVGTPAVYADEPISLTETRLVGRALDNRVGGFVVAQALRRLASGDRPAATVLAVNSVQEEVGLHGAQMMAYRLDPHVALVVDVTHATDQPGFDHARHGLVKLGAGPTVTHGVVNHPAVVRRLVEVASKKRIPLQHETTSRSSGTDTDVIVRSKAGVPSALVSIPLRYMHSPVETVDLGDVEAAIRLLAAFVRSLSPEDRFDAGVL